jgi:hypothetical protein
VKIAEYRKLKRFMDRIFIRIIQCIENVEILEYETGYSYDEFHICVNFRFWNHDNECIEITGDGNGSTANRAGTTLIKDISTQIKPIIRQLKSETHDTAPNFDLEDEGFIVCALGIEVHRSLELLLDLLKGVATPTERIIN